MDRTGSSCTGLPPARRVTDAASGGSRAGEPDQRHGEDRDAKLAREARRSSVRSSVRPIPSLPLLTYFPPSTHAFCASHPSIRIEW